MINLKPLICDWHHPDQLMITIFTFITSIVMISVRLLIMINGMHNVHSIANAPYFVRNIATLSQWKVSILQSSTWFDYQIHPIGWDKQLHVLQY